MLEKGGQSTWAKKEPLKEVKRLVERPETFLTPSFLPISTVHPLQGSYDEVSSVLDVYPKPPLFVDESLSPHLSLSFLVQTSGVGRQSLQPICVYYPLAKCATPS